MPGTLSGSLVREFYDNAKIFITGGTGFLGKALVEKLLRVCTNVDHIYLLIRVKKGKDPQTRLKELFKDPLFNTLRNERPDFEKKVTCISGDCHGSHLKMSDDDYNFLLNEVTHVFHSAATVRFNENLKTAVSTNVIGTLEVAEFCKRCTNLKILVHVSTAYANCVCHEIEEKFYKPPLGVRDIISVSESLSEEKLNSITTELIKPWPNTYAYTKIIAEEVIKELGNRVPSLIFRPGIVMGSLNEPVEGWIDNIYGPTGIIAAVGAGVMRVFYVDASNKANVVPVDLTVNAILSCAWKVGSSFNNNLCMPKEISGPVNHVENDPKIYNFVAHKENSVTWENFIKIHMHYGLKNPSLNTIWYYTLIFTKSKYIYSTLVLLLHLFPAVLIDGACLLLKKKPQMWSAYRKIHTFSEVMSFFAKNEWKFSNSNVREVWSQLNEADKKLFPFNMGTVHWNSYFSRVVQGIRIYIYKEDEGTLPAARRKMFFLWICHRFTQFCFIAFCFWALSKLIFML